MTRPRASLAGFLMALLAAASVSAQSVPDQLTERLSLERAVQIALDNNRQLQSARLQIDKAEADIEVARTRRLPSFQTEARPTWGGALALPGGGPEGPPHMGCRRSES